jgi:two-component system OmpR family response regulator
MPDQPGSPRTRVLLVEDDDSLRSAAAQCLSSAGFAVTAVATGADAVEAARDLRPDVLVIDLMLPDAGGLGVARAIRRQRALREVPVLFTTALSNPAVLGLLHPAPVLFKPFSRADLLRTVRGVAGPAQADGDAGSIQITSQ